MRILLVEDNSELANGLIKVLAISGFQVDLVATAEDAEAAIAANKFDLVILDLTLPDGDGLDVLKNIRDRGTDVPVIILTARGNLDDRVRGLDLGADDYLTKPFEVSELEARMRALIRRSAGKASSRIEFSGLVLDIAQNQLTSGETLVDVSPRELSVLRALLMAQGRIVPKNQLADSLSTFQIDMSDNAVEQSISRLRKRLAPHNLGIRTARGLGYYLFATEEGTV